MNNILDTTHNPDSGPEKLNELAQIFSSFFSRDSVLSKLNSSSLNKLTQQVSPKLRQLLGDSFYFQLIADSERVYIDGIDPENISLDQVNNFRIYIHKAAENNIALGLIDVPEGHNLADFQTVDEKGVGILLEKIVSGK